MNEREAMQHHFGIDPTLPQAEWEETLTAEKRRRSREYWAKQKNMPVEQITDEMVRQWVRELFDEVPFLDERPSLMAKPEKDDPLPERVLNWIIRQGRKR